MASGSVEALKGCQSEKHLGWLPLVNNKIFFFVLCFLEDVWCFRLLNVGDVMLLRAGQVERGGVGGVQISADPPGSTEMREMLHMHICHNYNDTLSPNKMTAKHLTHIFASAKGCKSLSNNHQFRRRSCNLRASWHYTCSSPQNHVWHLKTPSSSGSPRGQPIGGLVVKSSPDPPGRTKQHNDVSS